MGEALIENGLKKAKAFGYSVVTVFDSTGYFLKFGFKKASKFKLQAHVNMPDDAFLAMELQKNALKKLLVLSIILMNGRDMTKMKLFFKMNV